MIYNTANPINPDLNPAEEKYGKPATRDELKEMARFLVHCEKKRRAAQNKLINPDDYFRPAGQRGSEYLTKGEQQKIIDAHYIQERELLLSVSKNEIDAIFNDAHHIEEMRLKIETGNQKTA